MSSPRRKTRPGEFMLRSFVTGVFDDEFVVVSLWAGLSEYGVSPTPPSQRPYPALNRDGGVNFRFDTTMTNYPNWPRWFAFTPHVDQQIKWIFVA